MRSFIYFNCCMTGVLGVSDYGFDCIIDAENRPEALEWGNRVAAEYTSVTDFCRVVTGSIPHKYRKMRRSQVGVAAVIRPDDYVARLVRCPTSPRGAKTPVRR
jgi:hypothetical protein